MVEENKGNPARAKGRPAPRRFARVFRWVAVLIGVLVAVAASYAALLGATVWTVSHQIYRPLPDMTAYALPATYPPGVAQVVPPTTVPNNPPTDLPTTLPGGAATVPTSMPPTIDPSLPATLPAIAGPLPTADLPQAANPVLPQPTLSPTEPEVPAGAAGDSPGISSGNASPSAPDPAAALPAGRINILVLGTDQRSELSDPLARSDTMIILSVDPQAHTAGILSVPRDLQAAIPGFGVQKINAAYALGELYKQPGGGAGLAVATVSQFFNVPIPYYITVDFDGFRKIVDDLGGIDLYIPEVIDDPYYPGPYNSYIHIYFAPGCQHLNGDQALQYARTRHGDSDFARNSRQQQVIKAVRAKALSLNVLPQYVNLLSGLGNSITTNIPPDQQWAFVQLGGQIRSGDLYTAQLDYNVLWPVEGTSNFVLWPQRAGPLLDWFFGRGAYADARPGSVPAPVFTGPTPPPAAVAAGPASAPDVAAPGPVQAGACP